MASATVALPPDSCSTANIRAAAALSPAICAIFTTPLGPARRRSSDARLRSSSRLQSRLKSWLETTSLVGDPSGTPPAAAKASAAPRSTSMKAEPKAAARRSACSRGPSSPLYPAFGSSHVGRNVVHVGSPTARAAPRSLGSAASTASAPPSSLSTRSSTRPAPWQAASAMSAQASSTLFATIGTHTGFDAGKPRPLAASAEAQAARCAKRRSRMGQFSSPSLIVKTKSLSLLYSGRRLA
mmetsp:Transcript_92608/g.232849  ORF Transcript_92608/g.232849 Transcript_92608/m.232849 type:complete len:240 (-) Transcript_92608:496-1215(-)